MSERKAEFLQAMGQTTRLKILSLLTGGERCVCELQAALQEPQPNVSRPLTILRRAGLVQAWRSRNRVMYSLADSRIADLLSQVDTLVGADTAGRHLGGLEGMNTTMPTGDGAPEGRARAGDDKAGERPARDPREVPFTPGVGGAA